MIMGPIRCDISTFACCVEIVREKMFEENLDWGTFSITKDIYMEAASRLHKSADTIARNTERIANRCWDIMSHEQIMEYIGKPIKDIYAPSDMLFYLAYYVQFHKSYFLLLYERYQALYP